MFLNHFLENDSSVIFTPTQLKACLNNAQGVSSWSRSHISDRDKMELNVLGISLFSSKIEGRMLVERRRW